SCGSDQTYSAFSERFHQRSERGILIVGPLVRIRIATSEIVFARFVDIADENAMCSIKFSHLMFRVNLARNRFGLAQEFNSLRIETGRATKCLNVFAVLLCCAALEVFNQLCQILRIPISAILVD